MPSSSKPQVDIVGPCPAAGRFLPPYPLLHFLLLLATLAQAGTPDTRTRGAYAIRFNSPPALNRWNKTVTITTCIQPNLNAVSRRSVDRRPG
jgi:hypothetical protein